jgi:non-specific serine/threonine protein kinase
MKELCVSENRTPLPPRFKHPQEASVIGRKISHFEIVEKLGQGGMGVVYKARDLRLDRPVALKFLLPELIAVEEERLRFMREARLASMLTHPNICIIHDIHVSEGQDSQVFIVMEYVDGVNMHQRIKRDPLSVPEVLTYATQIAGALLLAHERGIVHRDLKCENIMINSLGQVKVMDFGLAKGEESEGLKQESATIGTIAYMAPEVLQGREANAQSDIFSFGVMLFEMLTGQLPFRGEHRPAMVYSILTAEPEPLERFRSDLPESLLAVVARLLKKDPVERYPAMAKVLADLKTAAMSGKGRSPGDPGGKEAGGRYGFPEQLTNFIGRRHQIQQLKDLRTTARLLTLTGPGGTGKTRLALQAAEEITLTSHERAFFISLSGLSDPGLVPSAVSQVLGVRESEGTSLEDAIFGFLQEKKTLLVLDNFEHLLKASNFVVELLAACPSLSLMITSREPLRIGGECEYPVLPMKLPERDKALSAEAIGRVEAVMLFAQRAAAVKPDFRVSRENASLVAAICVRLDGLPLAIELAAARIKHLTPQTILTRLDHRLQLLTGGRHDLPERQRTLRGTIEWSYELLDEAQRTLFRRLCVFAGGFSLHAVESLCPLEANPGGQLLDQITSLADKSLLTPVNAADDDPRFTILETIREFGLERLDESREASAIRKTHAEYFLTLAEQAEPEIWLKFDTRWIRRLTFELDNLRESLGYFRRIGDNERLMRLAGSVTFFFTLSNLSSEGRQWLEGAHSSSETLQETSLGARVLQGIGHHSWIMGDLDRAKSVLERSVTIYRHLGNELQAASALDILSLVIESKGDNALAREMQSEVIAVLRKEGRRLDLARVFANAIEPLDDNAAREMYAESLRIFRETGNVFSIVRALRNFGFLEYRAGNYARAKEMFMEALPIARDMRFTWHISRILNFLGDIARCETMDEQASDWYTESRLVSRKGGNKGELAWALCGLGFVSLRQRDYSHAELLFEESISIHRLQRNKRGLAGCLIGLAAVTMNREMVDRAISYLRAVDIGVKGNPMLLLPAEKIEFEQVMNSVSKDAGEERFMQSWQRASNLALDNTAFTIMKENTDDAATIFRG